MINNVKIEKGITLVALVITIIVLLILAGITIAQLTGYGLFNSTKKSREEYETSQEKEQKELQEYMNVIDLNGQIPLPENTPDTDAGTQVVLKEGWGNQNVKYFKTADGVEVTEIETVATVYAVSVGNGEVIPVPNDFYYVGGTLNSGVVISDNQNDKNKYAGKEYVGKDLEGNQFVWIPCDTVAYRKCNVWNDTLQTKGTLADNLWDTSTNTAEKTQVQKYGGFYIGRYEAGMGDCNNENQAVEFSEGIKYNSKITANSWLSDCFETAKVTKGVVKSKANQIPWFHADYKTALIESEKLYNTKSVNSGLITGTMYDVMLNFIIKDETTILNNSWGNYKDSILKNCTGKYCSIDNSSGSMTSEWTELSGNNSDRLKESGNLYLLTTGSSEESKKKNLYDVSGNLWEWTQEAGYNTSSDKEYFILRGGSFNDQFANRNSMLSKM